VDLRQGTYLSKPLNRPPVQAPLLWPSVATPPDEAMAIKDLYANLMGICYQVDDWRAALALYEFSKSQPDSVNTHLASKWRFIATNEAIMVLFHLQEAMKAIVSHKVRLCPSLEQYIDHDKLRMARKTLADRFPGHDDLRNATAHSGSIGTNSAKHAHDGIGLRGFFQPDHYSAPYNGALRTLPITPASLAALEEASAMFLEAFVPAAVWLERQGHAED
jgi:hypothetical protein